MPETAGSRIVLLRFSGEIAVKARPTRARFERQLVRNVVDAVRSSGIAGRVSRTRNRVVVATEDPRAPEVLARVFGVQSLSVASVHPAEKLAQVVETGTALFCDAVAGRRFAVRARRVGDRAKIAVAPRDVEHVLGAALLPGAAGVDLGHPEVTVRVELHGGQAYFCTDTLRGPAGLPLDVEGRAVALMSGGFDSPVAAWRMLRRGVQLDYLFCNLGGRAHQLGTLRVARVLAERWSYGSQPRLHALDFDPIAAEIRARTKTRYWQVILKRQMLRAAELVARERHADALVTGEVVGQVASQTLPNLATISQATSLPILRPLVGANKDEIIREAESIGTAALSAVMDEYCAMVASRPATVSKLAIVQAEEANLDPALPARAVGEGTVLDLRAIDPDDEGIPELEIAEVAADATVLDLRSKAAYAAWHWPGALRLDLDHALVACRSFDRARRYVSYCEFGLKSAHLAERMRAEGLEAWHFRGGLKALVAHARARGGAGPEWSGGAEWS